MQVTKKLSEKQLAKRSRLKAFVKVVNYNHIMPTRFAPVLRLFFAFRNNLRTNKICKGFKEFVKNWEVTG